MMPYIDEWEDYDGPYFKPLTPLSPYANQNNTGSARMLQQRHEELLREARSRQLERMGRDLQDIRYHINEIDGKIYKTGTSRTNPYSTYIINDHDCVGISCDECGMGPEPSVEVHEAEVPRWLERLIKDPIWEFFKRPRIKV